VAVIIQWVATARAAPCVVLSLVTRSRSQVAENTVILYDEVVTISITRN